MAISPLLIMVCKQADKHCGTCVKVRSDSGLIPKNTDASLMRFMSALEVASSTSARGSRLAPPPESDAVFVLESWQEKPADLKLRLQVPPGERAW